MLRQHLGDSADVAILDVGCGTGAMLEALGEFGLAHGVDVDQLAIDYCRERGLPNVRLGEACHLPYADETFDVVTALDVIEHLDDDISALSEMRRVLRPDGVLVVTVPAHMFLWGDQDEVNLHKRRYLARELKERLVATRFDVLRLSYINAVLFPVVAAVRLGRRLRRRVVPDLPHQSDFRITVPATVNRVLAFMFGAEAVVLSRVDIPFGVSIVAFARKEPA